MTKKTINVLVTTLVLLCIASIVFSVDSILVDKTSTLEQMLPDEDIAEIVRQRDLFGSEAEAVLVAIESPAALSADSLEDVESALRSLPGIVNTLPLARDDGFNVNLPFSSRDDTRLIYVMLAAGSQQLEAANTLSKAIAEAVGSRLGPQDLVSITGLPQIRAASWQISQDDAAVVLPLLIAVTLLVALIFFQSFTALALSLLLTSVTTGVCLALQLLLDSEISVLILLVVPVIWAISTLDAFHLYSRAQLKAHANVANPARAASKELFAPCLLTTVTTTGCFMTLTLLDDSPLIASFGLWASAGAVLAFILTFTMGEKLLSLHVFRGGYSRWPGLLALRLVRSAQRHAVFTIMLWGVLVLAAGLYISQLKISTSYPQVFTPDQSIAVSISRLQALTDTDMNPVDLVLTATDSHGEASDALLRAALLTGNYLNSIAETRLVLPFDLMQESVRSNLLQRWRAGPHDSESRDIADMAGSWLNEQSRALRLQVYMAKTTYTRKREIFEWLAHFDETMLSHHKITLSGPGYYYLQTEKRGQESLLLSSALSVLLIAVALFGITRKPAQALIALGGSIFPAVILAGCMAALNIPWSVAMLPMPALLLGLMNDDTIHMIWSEKKPSDRTFRRNAIMAGPALLATTLILSGAVATLVMSGIQTNQYLGMLIPLGLVLAFACNVTLIPALNSCLHRSARSRRAGP